MKISLPALRPLLPGLPNDTTVRRALDESGLEVKSMEQTGSDCHFSLEFLANRGDHRSYTGIATELAARLALTLTPLPATRLTTTATSGLTADMTYDAACLGYTLTPLTITHPHAPLSKDTRTRLTTAGLHTGLAVIDAAQATCLETGHPVLAYDADRVNGSLTLRRTQTGETFTPRGQELPRTLPAGLLVVTDQDQILALAGVIESTAAAVTPTTSRVLVECAAWDPVTIRRNAAASGLATAASQRFERGSDPATLLTGAGRTVTILKNATAQVAGPTVQPFTWNQPQATVSLTAHACNSFLGTDLTLDDIAERLTDYGFTHTGQGTFTLPTTRIWDVKEPEDLYEEVARHLGYDNLPCPPLPPSPAAAPTDEETLRDHLGEALLGLGFYETFTDAFYNNATADLIAPPDRHARPSHIHIQNAGDRRYALLKNNCLAQAITALRDNDRFKCHNVHLFEFTRTFIPDPNSANGLCHEHPTLWAIAQGTTASHTWAGNPTTTDFHYLRGAIEEMALRTHLTPHISPLPSGHPLAHTFHPHRSAQVTADGQPVAVIAEIHPDLLRKTGLTGLRPCYLEIDLLAWARHITPAARHPRPPFRKAPPIVKMLDFIVPQPITSQDVEQTLRSAAPHWLLSLTPSDVYTPPHLNDDERSITYTLTFASEPPRTADEINDTLDDLVRAVTEEVGQRGVRLRY